MTKKELFYILPQCKKSRLRLFFHDNHHLAISSAGDRVSINIITCSEKLISLNGSRLRIDSQAFFPMKDVNERAFILQTIYSVDDKLESYYKNRASIIFDKYQKWFDDYAKSVR